MAAARRLLMEGRTEAQLYEFAELIATPPADPTERKTDFSSMPASVIERLRLGSGMLVVSADRVRMRADEEAAQLRAEVRSLRSDLHGVYLLGGCLAGVVFLLAILLIALITGAVVLG